MPHIEHVLFHHTLFPTGSGIAELGLEQEVAGHGREPGIDLTCLATANLVHGRPHVVINAPARDAAQNSEGMVVGIKQHLVGLEQIGPHNKGPAVAELGMGDLELDPLAPDQCPILAPVKLESFARLKNKRNENAPAAHILLALAFLFPSTGKGRHTTIRAFETEAHQISMDLLDGAPLLARLAALGLQPA